MRKRLALLGVCAVLAGVAVAVGLGVREFTGGAFAEHAGTILYATLIYLLVCAAVLAWLIVLAILKPTTNAVEPGPVTLGGVALAACAVVELYQLTGVPAQLAAHTGLSRLVLGTTFHPADLLWYGVGAAATAGLHRTIRRRWGSPAGARRWPALIALLAIVVAVLWLGYHVTAAHEAQQVKQWVHATIAAGRVATSLHSERREAVAVVAGRRDSDYKWRTRNTDSWLADTYLPARKDLGHISGTPANLNRRIDDQLAALPQLRDRVWAGAGLASAPLVDEVMHTYGTLVGDLLRFRQEAVAVAETWHAPAALAAQLRSATGLAWAVEFAAWQQVIVSMAIAHGSATGAGIAQIAQTRDDLLAAVHTATQAAPPWRDRVRRALDQRWAVEAARLEQAVIETPPGQHLDIHAGLWRSVGIWRVQELQDVQYDIEVDVAWAVDYVPRGHWTWFWGSAAIIAVTALLIGFVVRLRRLLTLWHPPNLVRRT